MKTGANARHGTATPAPLSKDDVYKLAVPAGLGRGAMSARATISEHVRATPTASRTRRTMIVRLDDRSRTHRWSGSGHSNGCGRRLTTHGPPKPGEATASADARRPANGAAAGISTKHGPAIPQDHKLRPRGRRQNESGCST